MDKPKKADFSTDPRMSFNQQTGKWSYVGEDDVSYEYDDAVGAWFPMFDEKLMAAQSSVYAIEGVEETVEPTPKDKKKRKATYDQDPDAKKPRQEKPNTSIYITGLPADVTVDELETTFRKCGVFMEDLETGDPKIKIYTDDKGVPKGDALISFFKEESVPLSIELLDEAELRPGKANTKMTIQKAVFKEKDSNNAEKKKTLAGKQRAKKKMQQMHRKLDWIEEQGGKKTEKFAKIVILKHMYTLQELDQDPTLLLELKEDVREECERLGEVTNVILYDKSPDGVISVRFKDKESADACVSMMNDRYFAGRKISAEIFDGKTKYEKSGGSKPSEEDEEAEKQRLERYAKWLEEGGDADAKTP